MRIFTWIIAGLLVVGAAQAAEDTPKAGINAMVDTSKESNSADISPDEVWDMLGDHIKKEEEKNGYSIDDRTRAMAQASGELTRAQIVNVQEETVRKQMETVPDQHKAEFLNGSQTDLAHCATFRTAQAYFLSQREDPRADSFDRKSAQFESHLYLLAQAIGRVVNDPNYESHTRKEFKNNFENLLKTHYSSMAYSTDDEKKHYDGWDAKCTKITDVLTNGLEKRARARVTTGAVDARTDEILAELVASRR